MGAAAAVAARSATLWDSGAGYLVSVLMQRNIPHSDFWRIDNANLRGIASLSAEDAIPNDSRQMSAGGGSVGVVRSI